MREQIIMEDGWRSLSTLKLNSRYIGTLMNKPLKELVYSFRFKNNKEEPYIKYVNKDIKHMAEYTKDFVDYSKFKRGDSPIARRFVRHYILEYIKVVFEELLNGNTVAIGNNLFYLTFGTKSTTFSYVVNGDKRKRTRRSLYLFFFTPRTTYKKRKVKYVVKINKFVRKGITSIRKHIFYQIINIKHLK